MYCIPTQRGSPVLFCAVDFFRKVVYHKQVTYAGMVELADTLDLGSRIWKVNKRVWRNW